MSGPHEDDEVTGQEPPEVPGGAEGAGAPPGGAGGGGAPPEGDGDRERLIEAAAGAFRGRDPDGNIQAHPAWYDLDEAGRAEAYERARALRAVEAALDPEGLSTTARAVLARILGAGRR
ncbi:hypothetical protein [Chondromyces apiculatus]|uniref:Uncharacterized protein n=1 Tax=Chondromyces apiculatus DSM 436 TaxID=1192034 RepID=A0A017TET8_9BACT|nr:hypothetical protein [Chondromyces apiculatus]EYF07813.1 Hypothetical protein CAP_6835 [Chondromyces apiculatus DSM 436]